MEVKVGLSKTFMPSEDILAREIAQEFILVPIVTGIGQDEDEIFSLNKVGRVIWDKLDGKKSLSDIAKDLYQLFDASLDEIEKDVQGFARELLKRKMIAEVKK